MLFEQNMLEGFIEPPRHLREKRHAFTCPMRLTPIARTHVRSKEMPLVAKTQTNEVTQFPKQIVMDLIGFKPEEINIKMTKTGVVTVIAEQSGLENGMKHI